MKAPIPFASAALAIAMSLALSACGNDKAAPGAAGAGMPPPEVDVMAVATATASVTKDLPGRLQAWRTAQIRARVEGVVEKRTFVEGSDVKAGTPLFVIDPRSYKAAADAAKANVAVAKVTLERYKPLLEIRAVSKQEYDQAEAQLKQAEAALAKANIDLENSIVPAPIAGRIGRALVTEGALVGKNEATQLATIEQIDKLYANFSQTNTELLQLQKQLQAGNVKRSDSTKVEIVLEDGSTYPLPGKLLFSDLAVDPDTGAVNLRAEIPNPKKELLPGMFVRVRFAQAVLDDVIRVPQRAVQANPQGQFVTVVDAEGKVSARPIKTSGMSGANWIVVDGLKSGENIVVNGLQKAKPGGTVKPHVIGAEEALAPAGLAVQPPPATTAKPAAGKEG
ncbi:MAG: efflux RND transporter periplasmic adaptor subunit [Rhodocyclaceae bacterium]|nr:efflux RND transporter periplasmic adaptor subunit [Rhodocyclaceae bacterium]